MLTCIQIPYFCRNDPTSPNPIAVPAPNAEWPTRITIRKRHAATAAATVDAFDAVIDLGSSEAVLRPRDVLRRTPRPQPPPTTPPPPREEAAILSQMRRGGAPRLSLLLLFLLLLNLFLSLPSFLQSLTSFSNNISQVGEVRCGSLGGGRPVFAFAIGHSPLEPPYLVSVIRK